MRNPPEAERLQAYLRALHQPCTVLVSASHASFFKPAPRDAHAYIVQDPARPWVHHWVRHDGAHVVLDKKQSQRCPGFSGKVAVHIKDLTGKAKKKAPRYSTLLTVGVPTEREPEDPPAIRLIGI